MFATETWLEIYKHINDSATLKAMESTCTELMNVFDLVRTGPDRYIWLADHGMLKVRHYTPQYHERMTKSSAINSRLAEIVMFYHFPRKDQDRIKIMELFKMWQRDPVRAYRFALIPKFILRITEFVKFRLRDMKRFVTWLCSLKGEGLASLEHNLYIKTLELIYLVGPKTYGSRDIRFLRDNFINEGLDSHMWNYPPEVLPIPKSTMTIGPYSVETAKKALELGYRLSYHSRWLLGEVIWYSPRETFMGFWDMYQLGLRGTPDIPKVVVDNFIPTSGEKEWELGFICGPESARLLDGIEINEQVALFMLANETHNLVKEWFKRVRGNITISEETLIQAGYVHYETLSILDGITIT